MPVQQSRSYRFILGVVRPLLMAVTKRDWRGAEHLPSEGGIIAAANHTSYFDPLAVGHFLHDNKRPPRFLGKSELFKIPLFGKLFLSAGQIPVYRGTATAAVALRDAVAAIERGECITIYPEGTTTRDPDLWPMIGKTGAARMALMTGAPVVPIAQWGAERVISPDRNRVRLFPRQTMHVRAGRPVDLDDLRTSDITTEVLEDATERIMLAITLLLAEIRQETPPAVRFNPRNRRKAAE